MLIGFTTALIGNFMFAWLTFSPRYFAPYIGSASKNRGHFLGGEPSGKTRKRA